MNEAKTPPNELRDFLLLPVEGRDDVDATTLKKFAPSLFLLFVHGSINAQTFYSFLVSMRLRVVSLIAYSVGDEI